MNKLIMTVGLPRSGKSTWALSQKYPVVNPDSIRLALHGQPFIGLAEGFVWAIAKVMVRALFITGYKTVILDATNTTKARREEWVSKAWEQEFVVFDTPMNDCIKRAISSDKEYLVPVIEKMSMEMDIPENATIHSALKLPLCPHCNHAVNVSCLGFCGTELCHHCGEEFFYNG